jgi:hypothetical protein
LAKFLEYDSKTAKQTDNIEITFHFLIKLPELDKYQNYKIQIEIQSVDFIARNNPERFYVLFSEPFDIEIEYVDLIVRNSIVSVIENWIKSLEELQSSPILNFLKRKTHPFSELYLFSLFLQATVVVFGLYGSYAYLASIQASLVFPSAISIINIVILILFIMFFAIKMLTHLLVTQIRNYRVPNIVICTTEDEKNFDRYRSKISNRLLKIVSLCFAIILNIAAGLMSSYIFKYLGG